LGDIGVLVLAGLAAAWIRFAPGGAPPISFAGLGLGTLLAAYILACVRVYDLQRINDLHHQLPRLLLAWSITLCLVIGFLYATHAVHELSRL
jgi:hypothetical protein